MRACRSPAGLAITALLLSAGCGDTPEPAGERGSGESLSREQRVERGRELFAVLGCSACHVLERRSETAPRSLGGIYGRPVRLGNGTSTVRDEEYLLRAIRAPRIEQVAGEPPIMPSFDHLPDRDAEALVELIRSLR